MRTNNGSRRILYVTMAASAVIALGLAGCTSDDDVGRADGTIDSTTEANRPTTPDDTTDATSSTSSTSSTGGDVDGTGSAEPDGVVDPHGAIEIALAESPGAAVVEIERDTSDGVQVWELDLLTADGAGLEIKIAVDDGRVIKKQATTLDREQRTAPAVTAARIITKALDLQAGELLGAEIEREHGVVVWKVEIRTTDGTHVKTYFDPATGEVVQP